VARPGVGRLAGAGIGKGEVQLVVEVVRSRRARRLAAAAEFLVV
jgi:hypothetical protein